MMNPSNHTREVLSVKVSQRRGFPDRIGCGDIDLVGLAVVVIESRSGASLQTPSKHPERAPPTANGSRPFHLRQWKWWWGGNGSCPWGFIFSMDGKNCRLLRFPSALFESRRKLFVFQEHPLKRRSRKKTMHCRIVDWVLFCQWRPQPSPFDPTQPEVSFHSACLREQQTVTLGTKLW